MKRTPISILIAVLVLLPFVSAHEVYVLDSGTITTDFATRGINVFDALSNPVAWNSFLTGTLLVALGFILFSYLIHTKLSAHLDARFAVMRKYAHLVIRLGLGASFLYGAINNSIFGPELPLAGIPGGLLWKPVLLVIGLLFIFGAFTRLAALVGLIAYFTVASVKGVYVINYLNYFGELLVLVLERGELFSVDHYVKWQSHLFHHRFPAWFEKLESLGEKYSFPIIRMTFGIALIYAAVLVKILHPALSLDVLHNYHLDAKVTFTALFVVLAAGIIEIALGLILFFGVMYRIGMLILVLFVGYSVWFFGEAVWPHAILVGLGIGLFLHGTDKWCFEDRVFNWILGWTKRWRKSTSELSPK